VKYAWIEEHRDQFPVTRMCRQLGVSRTGYCQWRTRAPSDRSMANATLDAQVAAMHASSKCSYGRPRIVRGLREQGVAVSHERVRNSLKRQHLRPVYKRPYRVTTDSAHRKPIAPNVLDRRFDGWEVNHAWVADITYSCGYNNLSNFNRQFKNKYNMNPKGYRQIYSKIIKAETAGMI